MLHGIIPDEHTWPITFAYSVGSATGKGGMKAGGFFSLAFTVQRAIMSQLVYFAVAVFLVTREWLNWTIIHGFISGFGVDTGVFTTFVYLAALPALADNGLWMLGWLPGALFGLGTFVVLMLVGFFFGQTLQIAKKFGSVRIASFGRLVGARVLLYGGIAFVVFAPMYSYGIFNLLPVDAGTLMVVMVMVLIALPVMLYTWREVSSKTEKIIVK